MALIDYSDSDTEVSGPEALHNLPARPHRQSPSSRKRKQEELAETLHTNKPAPPSLPPSFHSLYATNVRKSTSDDPSLHGGRKRHVPHVEGNWPTHVYLECKPISLYLGFYLLENLGLIDWRVSYACRISNTRNGAPSLSSQATQRDYYFVVILTGPQLTTIRPWCPATLAH